LSGCENSIRRLAFDPIFNGVQSFDVRESLRGHDLCALFGLYRQRGNAENFIRELKNGFDLHHFPCQKLNANRAYCLIAAFAYNFMRFVGLVVSPTRPMFSKRIRSTLVGLACQVVRRARRTVFIFPRRYEKEVKRCLMNIRLTLGYG
jgi:hypothetical protein